MLQQIYLGIPNIVLMKFRNNEEDYIKSIYAFIESFGEANENLISADLKVSMPTVSEYLNKLEKRNIIKKLNRKILLTGYGHNLALPIVRKHRISEVFAVKMLDVPWEESHDAVMDLEHTINENYFNNLLRNLGNPQKCPHGNPINPGKSIFDIKLENASNGSYKISRITYENKKLLRELADMQILPESSIKVVIDGEPVIINDNGELKITGKNKSSIRIKSD